MARRPSGIDIGGVNEVEAGFDKAVEQGEARLLVRRPPEHIAAETERRHLDVRFAEPALFHGSCPRLRSLSFPTGVCDYDDKRTYRQNQTRGARCSRLR